MKKIMIVAALGAAVAATPALADDFSGVRGELTVGFDDAVHAHNTQDVTYGANVGVDAKVWDDVILGVEANIDNVFGDHRSVGASARVGYIVDDAVLLYAKAGYANWKDATSQKLDGLRVGAGFEVPVAGPVYAGAEYTYTDFEKGVGKHGARVKVGVRF